jgi:hypothetical protein
MKLIQSLLTGTSYSAGQQEFDSSVPLQPAVWFLILFAVILIVVVRPYSWLW